MNVIQADEELPPPEVNWRRPEMLEALANRDFRAIFRQLQKIGLTQNRIGWHTHQSQPEVSGVINGRRITAYDLISRIVGGLGIPRCLVGMGSCCCHDQCPKHTA